MKIIFFEIIIALGLKAGLSIHLNELMKFNIYIKGQGHSLTFAKDHTDFKIKTCFSQKQLSHLKPNLIGKHMGVCE